MACPGLFSLFVSNVEKEGPFLKVWGQRDVEQAKDVERQLLQCTQEFDAGAGLHSPGTVAPDDLCCARYSDGSYYRARVIDVDPKTGHVGCAFIDYGNRDRVPITEIRIPQNVQALFRTPPQATSFILSGVVGSWDLPVLRQIMDKIGYESVSALVLTTAGQRGEIPLLKIFHEGKDYCDELQTLGFATVVPQANFEKLVWNTLATVSAPPTLTPPMAVAPPYAGVIHQGYQYPYQWPMWQKLMETSAMSPTQLSTIPMASMPAAVIPTMTSTVPVPTVTNSMTMTAVPAHSSSAVSPAVAPLDMSRRGPLLRFEPTRLQDNTDHKVYVSHVQKGTYSFAVQLATNDKELEAMVAKLNSPTMTYTHLKQPYVPGMICLAKYSQDDSIYRGVITNVDSIDSVLVYFVDYGNTDAVKCRDLFEIPAEFTYPKVMAIQLSLARLDSSQVIKDTFDIFYDIALEKDAVIQVVPSKCEDLVKQLAELYIEDTNIDELINIELTKRKPKAPKLEFRNVELPAAGSKVKVIVAYVKSVSNFFVQLAAKKKELDSVMALVNQYCNGTATPLPESEVQPGAACCALFAGDGRWYRSMVINPTDLTVMYVDYGNEEKVPLSNLKCAGEQIIMTRSQAIPCMLAGVEDNDELSSKFEDMSLDETMMMHVEQLNESVPQLVVRLFDKDGKDVCALLQSGTSNGSLTRCDEPGPINGHDQVSTASQLKSPSNSRSKLCCDDAESGGRKSLDRSGFEQSKKNGRNSSVENRDTRFTDQKDYGRDYDKRTKDRSEETFSERSGDRNKNSNRKWEERNGDKKKISGTKWGERSDRSTRHNGVIDSQDIDSKVDPSAWGIGERGGEVIGHCDRTESTAYDKPRKDNCGGYGRKDKVWDDSPIVIPSIEKLKIDINSKKQVHIVFTKNPNDFYLHERPSDPSFQGLLDDIADSYSNGGDPLPSSSVTVGTACVAKYSEDEAYYRAKITKLSGSNVEVLFVDYGNVEIIDCNELRVIKPSMLRVKAQAIHCKLMGIPENDLSEDKVKEFNTLSDSESLEAEFVDLKNDVYSIILRDLSSNTVVNVTFGASQESLVSPTSMVTTLQHKNLVEGTSYEATVSWFETPGKFYVQLKSLEQEFKDAMIRLQESYKQMKPLSLPCIGQAVVAKFKGDNAFYRSVVKVQRGDKFGVEYVDYGNRGLVDAVYGLQHQYSTIPVYANLCTLQGILPAHSPEWEKRNPDLMKQFEGDFLLTVVKSSSEGDVPSVVSLNRNGQDLAQDLISQQLAVGMSTLDITEKVEDVPETHGVDLDILVGQTLPAYVVGAEELTAFVSLEAVALARLREDISQFSSEQLLHLAPQEAVFGKSCLVLTLNAEYRRAVVINAKSTVGVTIKFMDHAGRDEIPCDNIYCMPEKLASLPPMVFEATFENVKCPLDLKSLVSHTVALAVTEYSQERLQGHLLNGSGQEFPFVERTYEGLLPLPILKRRMKVEVVHASGVSVWLQPVNQAHAISKLLDDMFAAHEGGSEPLMSFQCGTVCSAKSLVDDNWYRAVIENEECENVRVRYVDYGNEEILPSSNLKKLADDFLCMHALAVNATLPIVTEDPTLEEKILEIAADKAWTAEFVRKDDKWFVELLHGEEQLSLEVVRTGRAFSMDKSLFPTSVAGPPVNLSVGSCVRAEVSFIKSAMEFYVHLESNTKAREKMQEDLQAVSHCMSPLNLFPETGSMIMAQYSEDSLWYRGKVLPGQNIIFVDYGNVETVELSSLRSLPPAMESLSPLALKCSLVAPVNKTWSENVMEQLVQHLESEPLLVVVNSIQDDAYIVDVSNPNATSVSSSLAEQGFLKDEMDGGDTVSVFVTSVISPSDFWVCIKDSSHSLMHCGFYLPSYYNQWADAALSQFKELVADGSTLFEMMTLLPGDPVVVSLSLDGKKVDEHLLELCSPWKLSGASVEGTVVFANSPSDFYVHLSRDSEAVEEMASNMEKAEEFGICEETRPGTLCAALYSENHTWYRAKVLSQDGPNYTVSFIDFGNEALTSDIRALPQHLHQIPPLALRCSLPTPHGVPEWQESASQKFDELISSDDKFEVELLSSTEPFIANLICAGCNVAHQIASLSGIGSEVIDEEIKALRSSLVSPTSSRGQSHARVLTLEDVGEVQVPTTPNENLSIQSIEDYAHEHLLNCQSDLSDPSIMVESPTNLEEYHHLHPKPGLETIMEADSSSDAVQDGDGNIGSEDNHPSNLNSADETYSSRKKSGTELDTAMSQLSSSEVILERVVSSTCRNEDMKSGDLEGELISSKSSVTAVPIFPNQGTLLTPTISNAICNFPDVLNREPTKADHLSSEAVVQNTDELVSPLKVDEDTEVVVSVLSYPNMISLESDVDGVPIGQCSAKASHFKSDLEYCVPGTKLYAFEDCENHRVGVDVVTSAMDDS